MYKIMKILIIKLSAIGDVLRTTTLLHGLKRKWPRSEIFWITSPEAADLLMKNGFIDRLLVYDRGDVRPLEKLTFDLLICLDKEKDSALLTRRIVARRKIGFGCDDKGMPCALNRDSRYAYKLGISDELKFRINKKTYPEIIYQMCSLKYKKDRYVLNLTDRERGKARSKLARLGIKKGDFLVGLNTGAGHRFINKMWGLEKHKLLINKMLDMGYIKILLLGGKREENLNQKLKKIFGDKIYNAGSGNTLRQFASIIAHCNVVITGDTLSMHIGIALNRYVIAIFGPTCSQEIELYGNGKKIISDIGCAPCYKKRCGKKDNCMSRIEIRDVIKAIPQK